MSDLSLNFMHPHYGTVFSASVDAAFSVNEMLRNLTLCGFVPERPEGYALWFMGKALEGSTRFEDLEQLYEGAILRVVECSAAEESASRIVRLNLKLPRGSGWTTVDCIKDWTIQDLLLAWIDSGLLPGAEPELLHGAQILDAQQTPEQLGLRWGDWIEARIVEPALPSPTDTRLERMEQTLDELRGELAVVRAQMPKPSSLPLSASLHIAPTQVVYESLDGILADMRGMDQLPPARRIKPESWIPWVLLLVFLLMSIIAGVFWERLAGFVGGIF